MIKIKLAGIYKISIGEYYYIGKSISIFDRWQSHYTSLKRGNHSSNLLQDHFNQYGVENLTFNVLERVSYTEWKKGSNLRGNELKKAFGRYLICKEREWMKKFSINYCLNKDDKWFS